MMQGRGAGGSNQGGSSEGREKWLDSGYSWKKEPQNLGVECENEKKKKKSGMTPTINRRMKLPFIAMGRTLGGVDFEERIRSSAY